MKRVLGSIAQQVDQGLSEHGLTQAQWGPLFRMREAESSTVAGLAREMHMDVGAMTRLLDRLEKKGLCRRERSTEDRRVVQVELTPEGERAAAEVPPVLAEVLNHHLAGFSRAEWEALKEMLRRMLVNGETLRGE
jgi:DNA-binding MarR family transcriptional regulator